MSSKIGYPLDDFIKLWLKAKTNQMYRQDPFLKHIDSAVALSHLYDSLVNSKSFTQLEENLKISGFDKPFKISRKNDGKSFFEYPTLAFQLSSLAEMWPVICEMYRSEDLLEKSSKRFGHRPNLDSDFSTLGGPSSINSADIKVNCSLKIPFQDEYPAFKNKTTNLAKDVLEKSSKKNANVLLVQSDIQAFFQALKLDPLAAFISVHFPAIAPVTTKYFARLKTEFGFDSLPIGWVLSGVYSDLVWVKIHELMNSTFNTQFSEVLFRLDPTIEIVKHVASSDLTPEIREQIRGLISTSEVTFNAITNYVDDSISIFEYQVSEHLKNRVAQKAFEKIVTHSALDLVEKVANSLFDGIHLKFYRPDDNKGKFFSFDRTNIDTLASNFFSLANNTPSDPDEPNLWTKLDEFLLPADNDLTLNERTQFFAHLANLRHKVLEGTAIPQEELDDIFQKILLKIQGPEARYIASVLKLLEVLVISNKEEYFDYCNDLLSKIFDKFQTTNKSLDLWLRFFTGYFRIFQKVSYKDLSFFDDFDRFKMYWSKSTDNLDDLDLLEATRISFLIKSSTYLSEGKSEWLEVMDRRRQGHDSSGILSKQFLAFNVSPRRKSVKIHINKSADAVSVAVFLKMASRLRWIDVDTYLRIGKKIKEKTSVEAAIVFFNISAASIVPKWSDDEVEIFFQKLGQCTSNTHSVTVRRLYKKAKTQLNLIGDSYLDRLRFVWHSFVNLPQAKLRNIPTAFGGGDPSQYRSIIFFLATLESNSLYDLRKAYLSALVPIENVRDLSYLHVPTTLRTTGLAFYRIQREFVQLPRNAFAGSILASLVKGIGGEDLKKYLGRKTPLEKFKSRDSCYIDLSKVEPFFAQKQEELLLTLCPIGMDPNKSFNIKTGLKFFVGMHEKLDLKIESAINEAKKRKSDAIIFPELTLPRRYLGKYLRMCGNAKILLIGGLEYTSDFTTQCRNSTIISFPVDPKSDPYQRSYIAFEQDKHFPAAEEKQLLETGTSYQYLPGSTLFLFSSKKYCDFSVLTCSDFLSLRLRLRLQEKVQTVFVPAQNLDMTTYNHIAESSIRDLHCFAIVCNNQEIGGSFAFAPYRDKNQRAVFRKDGETLPEFLTMRWRPLEVSKSQKADSQVPFRTISYIEHMKQTPPDWGYDK